MLRRSWLEVDMGVLESNYHIYNSCINPKQEIMAVVKADAYGIGSVEVAQRLLQVGCKHFAVSNIDEGILLRESGISGQILVLGYTPISSAELLLKYDITQTVYSEEYAKQLDGRGLNVHFAIDTGMNRIGLDAERPDECQRIIREYSSKFNITGLFTHLCAADTIEEEHFTKEQVKKFKTVCEGVSSLNLPYIHCLNSAGGLWSVPYGNLVRLGILLYGLKPDYNNVLPPGIKSVIEWKSVISMIKKVYPGETIGYGRTYKVDKEMTIATIPTGYADGYNRLLSNKGHVLINGKSAPIVGRVCMDQMMVDVSGIDVSFEDEVILLDNNYNADDMAHDIGNIGYEVICNISKRVPRIYK